MGPNSVTPKEGEKRGAKLVAPDDIEGGADRRCTDVLFMLVLILAWLAMTYLGVDGISNGNPDLLLNGIDYDGRICGVDDGVKDKSKLYYIRFDGTGVCVEECPTVTNFDHLWGCTDEFSGFTVDEGYDCSEDPLECAAKADVDPTGAEDGGFGGGDGAGVCMYQVESVDFVGRCVFSEPEVLDKFVDVGGDVAYLQEAASDVYAARGWIFGFGFCFSTILGFFYLGMLQLPGLVCMMIWGSIACVFFILVAMGFGFVSLSEDWEGDGEHTDTQVMGSRVTGYLAYGCAFLFLCLIVFLRKQIALANGIIKESVRAIGAVKMMFFMPLLQCAAIAAFLVPWVVYSVYTASMADITTEEVAGLTVKSFEYSDEVEKRGWYLLFVFFWTTQFIVAMGQIVVALTVVKYYFTRDVETVNNGTFWKSLKEGLRFHTGTAAFGSLIIAIIKTIRAMLTYMQKKLQKSGSKAAQAVLCCLSCFFWCLEKCVKFINKNAYIQVAIFSTSFCRSSKNAFWLIARNLARVGAVTVVTDFVVFIMKLVIGLGTAGATYLFLQNFMKDDLYSPMGPVFFAGVMAYYVASSFAALLGMTTLTILQCFIADEEMFEGEDRYARNDLKDWLDAHGVNEEPSSPRMPKKKEGRKGGEEKEEGYAVETGTA
ncbi:unnamed protein product [Ectocarpus sp. 6 AP-2014]